MNMSERRARCWALVRKYYAGVPTRESLLGEAVTPMLGPQAMLLDAGCGSTFPLLREYAGRVSFGIGIDRLRPASAASGRVAVVVGDLEVLPFRTGAFDAVISRSMTEHLEDPIGVFCELRRVVKRDGRIVITTPNKYDYSSVVARLIPDTWSTAYVHWALGDTGHDHFPVFYRANTRRAFRRIADKTQLRLVTIRAVRHYPQYFLFSPMLFRLGMLYDWLITWLQLDSLQPTWLVVMERLD